MAGSEGVRRFSAGYTASQEETSKDAYGVNRTILSDVPHGGWATVGVGGGGGGRGHPCTHCGREFRSRSNLSRHVRDHHTSHDPSAALCPVCGKNCRNRSNVLTHMYRVHHVTARQLDAFTHSTTFPHLPPPASTRSDAHPTNAQHQLTTNVSSSSSSDVADRSEDLAASGQTQGVQAFGTNAQSQTLVQQQQQQQQQQLHMSYGYDMQGTTAHHHHHHQHQHHHHPHHHHPLQDNT